MSLGFLFESFPANTHGGQQMPSKLFAGNLAYSVTNDGREALISQVGKVVSAAVVSDEFSGQSKGFGFVEMESSGDAAKAISEFDGKDLEGRNLKVNEAKPREFGAAAAAGTTVAAVAAGPTAGRSEPRGKFEVSNPSRFKGPPTLSALGQRTDSRGTVQLRAPRATCGEPRDRSAHHDRTRN
jgi:RNA recognition motif-containing protein